MSERSARTVAEWTTLAASCAVLLVLVASIVVQMRHGDEEANPIARIAGPARVVGEQHVVDVEVSNGGDLTASDVQVSASLVVDGETTEGDQTIDFLAGGEVEELVFVFADDPADGELTVAVTSFGVP